MWAETVAGGSYTHRVLARGTELRLTDLEGDACAHLLAYVADRPWERLNVADTVKVQWNAYLRRGPAAPLRPGPGARLASSPTPPAGTTRCAAPPASRNDERYGDGSRRVRSPAGRELFKLAAAKHGLAPRDLPPCSPSSRACGSRGRPPGLRPVRPAPAASVTLRAEQDVTRAARRQRAAPARPARGLHEHAAGGAGLAGRGRPGPGDPLWDATPEGRRAFVNTADLTARGIA